jgi:hypothetical protein
MSDDDIRQRIAIFEAAVAAYVLDSLNPASRPTFPMKPPKTCSWCLAI